MIDLVRGEVLAERIDLGGGAGDGRAEEIDGIAVRLWITASGG